MYKRKRYGDAKWTDGFIHSVVIINKLQIANCYHIIKYQRDILH